MLKKVEEILGKTEGIESYQTIGGYGVVTNTYQPNYGSLFARLKPWEERHGDALHVKGIMASLQKEFAAIPEGVIFPSNTHAERIWRCLRFQLSHSGSHRNDDC